MRMFFKILAKIISGILAIIVILFVATLLPIPGNVSILIVQSGSMEPAIRVGSIVAVKPVETYKIGDVITFEAREENNLSVTHRIVDLTEQRGRVAYITKGDANEDPDSRPIARDEIVGKVFLDIPYVGYAITFARTPLGFMILIVLPLLIIALDEIRKIIQEVKKGRNRSIHEENRY